MAKAMAVSGLIGCAVAVLGGWPWGGMIASCWYGIGAGILVADHIIRHPLRAGEQTT